MSDRLLGDDVALKPAAQVDDAFGRYFGNAPNQGESAALQPRARSGAVSAGRARTFAAHMDSPEDGETESRLESMRSRYGWGYLRPRWWNQDSRNYQQAYKAEKLRYQGFGGLAERLMDQREHSGSASGSIRDSGTSSASPEAGASPAVDVSTQRDARLVNKYNAMKGELKSAAGWKRFLPFSQTRRDYKAARQELRTGRIAAHESGTGAFAKFAANMPSVRAKQAQQAEMARQDKDLLEVTGLLGGPLTKADTEQQAKALGAGLGGGQAARDSLSQQLDDDETLEQLNPYDDNQSEGGGEDDDDEAKDQLIASAIEKAKPGGGMSAFGQFIAQMVEQLPDQASPNAHGSDEINVDAGMDDDDDNQSMTDLYMKGYNNHYLPGYGT